MSITARWPARRRPSTFGALPGGDRLRRVEASPGFRDGALRNTLPTEVVQPGSDVRALVAALTGWRRRQALVPIPLDTRIATEPAGPPEPGLRLTWLGHATVFAELDGHRVLFDPVWSGRCSPFTWVGPRRHRSPPVPVDRLPAPDVVVISHDHYDHLDLPTVRTLASTTAAVFAVPLGVGAHLEHWGVAENRIVELDWHETGRVAGLSLTAAPARHYSCRGLRPSRTTLWSSWVVAGPEHRIFHCGDSGYFSGLRDIGAAYGPFDATLMPIGAYDDRWRDVHLTPEEAVAAHRDLRGELMLPIHWATFALAPHPWAEPIERAVVAARSAGVNLVTPVPGQPVHPARPNAEATAVPWWRTGRAGAGVVSVTHPR